MRDWNVVATVKEHSYEQACALLRDFGIVAETDFFNVLVMRVQDTVQFVDDLHGCLEALPAVRASLARVMPVSEKFSYQSVEEFEALAKQKVEPWVARLAGTNFHVRMHRRGFKGRLSSQHEELFVDHHIMDRLHDLGQDARIGFDDPDFIIALETVGQDCGLSIWNREQRQRYSLLKLD